MSNLKTKARKPTNRGDLSGGEFKKSGQKKAGVRKNGNLRLKFGVKMKK